MVSVNVVKFNQFSAGSHKMVGESLPGKDASSGHRPQTECSKGLLFKNSILLRLTFKMNKDVGKIPIWPAVISC